MSSLSAFEFYAGTLLAYSRTTEMMLPIVIVVIGFPER